MTQTMVKEMTIKELVDWCFKQAKASGWCDKPVPIPEQIALIHSEASEALESWRNNEPISDTVLGKPEGLASEYADIIIRIAHYSKLNGIDLEYELRRKLEYNATRAYRHGNKRV